MAAKSIFCAWHIVTVENSAGTDCSAHLDSGHCFECPFEDPHHARNAEFACADFEPLVQADIHDYPYQTKAGF